MTTATKRAAKRPKRKVVSSEAEVIALKPIAVKLTTAAQLLDCGLRTVYNLIEQGKLKASPCGKDQRVLYESIERYAEGK